jgi:hypothetical protein
MSHEDEIADLLAKGLAAEKPPADFTQRVMEKLPLTLSGARPDAPPPLAVSGARPDAPPPLTLSGARAEGARGVEGRKPSFRRFLAVAAATWGIVFLGMLVNDRDLGQPGRMAGPVVARRTGDADDPRARWVKLDLLAELKQANLIDGVLASGVKQGYRFEAFWDGEDPQRWWVIASPAAPGKSGERWFYLDPSGEIRFEVGKVPTKRSPTIGG